MRRLLALAYLRGSADGEAAQTPIARDEDSPGAALTILADGLPEEEQAKIRRTVLVLLREAHDRLGTKPPPWLGGILVVMDVYNRANLLNSDWGGQCSCFPAGSGPPMPCSSD